MTDIRSRAGTLAGVCVAIVLALAAIHLLRSSGPETPAPSPVPTTSIEIPQTKMRCSDPKCVAVLARELAAKLSASHRTDDAKHILDAAEALERNDCDAAIDARNAVQGGANNAILIEGAAFTGELMNVCLLGGDMFASRDAGVFRQDLEDAARSPDGG